MTLFRDSERVSPNGNVTSRGVLNQLGRPQLEPLAVLVREAVQNSWDARGDTQGGITFGVAGWSLNSEQRTLLKNHIFSDLPPSEHLPLAEHLNSEKPLHVMAIYDRGTTGLGGPTRADQPLIQGEDRDFVDFLRNVGQPTEKKFSGGTYGYGKAAFYRVGGTQTICVFTRCIYRGKLESRFIASALGTPFADEAGILYTGRHWWGEKVNDIAEPITETAEMIATQLGVGQLLGPEALGTVILILQPQLELRDEAQGSVVRTPLQAMHFIAENILLYFWPKMLKYGKFTAPINFEISWEGQTIPMPAPEDFPPLQGYVQAMYRLKKHTVKSDFDFPYTKAPIKSERPVKLLGELALQKHPILGSDVFDTGQPESAFARLHHHTVLMRQPELVVKYVSGSASTNPQVGIYGVFITDPGVDAVFSEAEPPTHDDWVSTALTERWHRIYVNGVYKRISEQMDMFAKPADAQSTSRQLTPLGAFSNSLGTSLLSSVPGNSASTPFSKAYQPPRPSNLVSKSVNPELLNGTSDVPSPNNGQKPSLFGQFRALIRGAGANPENAVPTSQPRPLPPPPVYKAPDLDLKSDAERANGSSSVDNTTNGYQSASLPSKPIKKPLGISKVIAVTNGEFVIVDGKPALKVAFEVEHGKNAVGTEVSVEVRAVIDGGKLESEPPLGASRSEVIRWIDAEETIYAGSSSVFVASDAAKKWAVVVSLPDDMMIDLDLEAKAKGENE